MTGFNGFWVVSGATVTIGSCLGMETLSSGRMVLVGGGVGLATTVTGSAALTGGSSFICPSILYTTVGGMSLLGNV